MTALTDEATSTAMIARPRRFEPVSPFVAWSADERAPLPDLVDIEAPASLVADLLRDPDAVVERLLDPQRIQSLVLGTLLVIGITTGFFGATAASGRFGGDVLRAGTLVPLNALMALAAALGPIYATGLLVAARLPLAKLVATLLSSAATGALILGALAPIPYALWEIDPVWAGPLSLVGAFALSAVVAGARMHGLLRMLAEAIAKGTEEGDKSGELSDGDRFRVGIIARMSLLFLAFTSALSMWAFDAFL